ncbi:MAG: hypothetical protein R3B70_01360 [Polyangiaceae bacterium]
MGSAPANAEKDPTPSPAPASDVRLIPDGAILHALQRTDLDGARISAELYGDDDDDELAALVAGTHPCQRRLPEDALAASKQQAARIPTVRR